MGNLISITITSNEEVSVSLAVTGVTVSPSTVSVQETNTTQLTAVTTPSNATDQTGIWSSSNSLATVDSNGLVTGVADGEVIITFTTTDGSYSDSTTVTVENPPVAATGVTVTPSSFVLGLSGTTQLTRTMIPSNANDQTGVWSSSDTGVCTVDSNGLVTSVATGFSTITYTTTDGSFTDTCEIETTVVVAPVLDSAVLTDGDYILTFSQPVGSSIPEGGYDTYIDDVDQNDRASYTGFTRTITGLDTSVAHTFKLEGRYIDLVPPEFPQSNEITVPAEVPATVNVTSVSVSPATYSLENTRTTQLTKTVLPANATDKSGVWSSDTPAVATVDSNGLVTNAGVDSGTATITYTTTDGSFTDTCVITAIPFVAQTLKAFPTAYGAGSGATGGRGKTVYHVTNLNDSGAGSFRDAVSQSNRTIVFDVSGTIELGSSPNTLTIEASNLTIAGQTSPNGITLCGYFMTTKNADNIIMRYMKMRYDLPDGSWGNDAWVWRNCNNIIIDHCSLSWGGDEILTFYAPAVGETTNNITIQNCLLGEGKTGSIFGDSDDNTKSDNLSFLRNIYYNVTHRHPNMNTSGRGDIINNIVFNWKYLLSRISGPVELNHISNYYSLGSLANLLSDSGCGLQISGVNPSIYTTGNIVDKEGSIIVSKATDSWTTNTTTNLMQDWNDGAKGGTMASLSLRSGTKFADMLNPPTIIEADVLVSNLTADVGSYKTLNADGTVNESWDVVDTAYKTGVSNGTGISYVSSSGGHNYHTTSHWSTFWASVSTTSTGTRDGNYYSTNPHIPETWFDANVPGGEDHNDIAPSGYTWLEEFLNQVDVDY